MKRKPKRAAPVGNPIQRAFVAWFRYPKTEGGLPDQPSPTASGTKRHDGMNYVLLRDAKNRLLAVYRVRNDGQLKRLVRWSRKLAE